MWCTNIEVDMPIEWSFIITTPETAIELIFQKLTPLSEEFSVPFQFSFFNKLPLSVVICPNLITFQQKLKIKLLEQPFYSFDEFINFKGFSNKF